jgi:hypothetical protein
MGEYANDGAALTFIQAAKWDSTSNGSGTAQDGMLYYNTASDVMKLYANGAWVSLSSGGQIIDWQDSVLDRATAEPTTPASGARYIVALAGEYAITVVDTVSKTFTVAGDHTTDFVTLDKIKVSGSTGNDGQYTVVSSTYDVNHTDIVVSEVVSSAVANGTVQFADGALSVLGIDNIVVFNGASYDVVPVAEGFASWVEDENIVYVFNGSNWVKMSAVFAHNDLSGLNAGDYQHLTATQLSGLTGGNDTTLHTHDGRYFTESELGSVVAASEGASLIGTDTKTNLNNATTVEVALTYLTGQDPAKRSSGADNPNGVVAGVVGDVYIETTRDLVYTNVTGANTGWVIL